MPTLEILAKKLDHSTLQSFLAAQDIRIGCEIARRYSTASIGKPGSQGSGY